MWLLLSFLNGILYSIKSSVSVLELVKKLNIIPHDINYGISTKFDLKQTVNCPEPRKNWHDGNHSENFTSHRVFQKTGKII